MFKLGKLEFEVESAVIDAVFSDAGMGVLDPLRKENQPEFKWYLEIEMKDGDFVTEWIPDDEDDDDEPFYESVSPILYHNNGFRMDVKSWKDLEGMSKTWESDCNEDGEEAGYLYVFEHEDVTSGTIEFLKREGNVFYVKWNGTANVFWNDEYGEDVPFEFEGDATFKGLLTLGVDVTNLEDVKIKLSKYIDMGEFEFESEECNDRDSGENGMKIVHRFYFVPKV